MIGRQVEIQEMTKLLTSTSAEMLAVIGRRRVGKTFLIRKVYAQHIRFEIVGTQHATQTEQLSNFKIQLQLYFSKDAPKKRPKNWLEAFNNLSQCLEKEALRSKKKLIIFIDELPWLAETSKKKFVEALGYFWNSWASKRNILIVICGSAASWITNHVVNTKGGLYNRITKSIHLKPFTLYESKLFLESKNIHLNNYQILQLYMALGGIPHYLDQVEAGRSASENLQKICFETSGTLYNEFQNLYEALFKNAHQYIAIIKALQSKWQGLTRQELLQVIDKKDGGTLTKIMNDLLLCDFIIQVQAYNHKKNHITYRLIDEYSIFYLSFIDGHKKMIKEYWLKKSQSNDYKIWSGYAFENICFRHQSQIIKAMQLMVIQTDMSSFYSRGNDEVPGTQIDMVLKRADKVINLFEIKFYQEPVFLSKSDALGLRTKMAIFKNITKTKKQLFLSMISVFGVAENEHSNGLVVNNITADDLFAAL